jgi:cyclophilin family peptidyl-prolyl cis-trans isomerase/HEAT repeat protein
MRRIIGASSSGRILGSMLVLTMTGCGGSGDDTRYEALAAVLGTEDARPSDPAARQPLVDALTAEDAWTRRFATRAMGRLEDPGIVPTLAPLLSDPDPEVRSMAAFAVAQAVHGADGTPALEPLLAAARSEADATVRGALARALGRIRPAGTPPDGVLPVLLGWLDDTNLPAETALGLALGLESLSRSAGAASSDARIYDALSTLATYTQADAPDVEAVARVRSVSVLALGQRGRLEPDALGDALRDQSPSVRATAARFLGATPEPARSERILRSLEDPAPIVRIEAVRSLASGSRDDGACRSLLGVARSDGATVVRLVALQALAEPCDDALASEVASYLQSVAAALVAEPDAEWAPAAYALSALAVVAPEEARRVLPAHGDHPNAFVRASAADVAASLSDGALLAALATDPDPNVRNAALPALVALEGRSLDPLLVDQLASDDGQLLMTVAELLDGTSHAGAAEAAMTAFERISAARRETARDPRMALLALLRTSGSTPLTPRLEPYLQDYDAVVAAEVATVLGGWTGARHEATPQPAPRLPLPGPEQLAEMDRSLVVLHMAAGGEVVIDLLPLLAPTNAFRFYRLAGEGYFDGLTFHRWVPNFVLQGGSPSANEYAGDGPYTRDEIGLLPHWRGTVGLSTRGRDTGDGQIFVNLVNNVRLDYDYTLFGEVVSGMDVVDSALPGAVILRAEIRPKD